MPPIGRVMVPNDPHHVVQRGHNRQIVFAEAVDFEYYLVTVGAFEAEFGLKVYGSRLRTQHVHLVLKPGARTNGQRAGTLPLVKLCAVARPK